MAAWLPPLVCLPDFGGDWYRYIDAVYGFFQQDFLGSTPYLQGRRCAIRRGPVYDGKEASFWHLVSEGKIEDDRTPDLRRCERIRWPRPIIEAVRSGRVRCWRSDRKGDDRIVLALEDFSYVVILSDCRTYVLLLTAYPIERVHRREKFRKEYDRSPKC